MKCLFQASGKSFSLSINSIRAKGVVLYFSVYYIHLFSHLENARNVTVVYLY